MVPRHLRTVLFVAVTATAAALPGATSGPVTAPAVHHLAADTASAPALAPAADSLRRELLRRGRMDRDVRDSLRVHIRPGDTVDSVTVRRYMTPAMAVDSSNRAWMRGVLKRFGWPGRTFVGDAAADAAWLLVQHADADTAFQVRALGLMKRAADAGEAQPKSYAYLADRVAEARGRPQIYGTQAEMRDGRISFKPIEDSARVDARRAAVGLPPLAEYRRVLESAYRATPSP